MKVAGAPGHRDRFRSGRINDEPKYLQMIRSFKDKGLRGHLGGKLSKNWVYQNWGPFVTEPRAVATGLLSRLTSSTMKGPVATARGSVTISCSWHGRPSSRAEHYYRRYGD